MTDHVQITVEDKIQLIRINRPEKKNALTQAMYGAMADALNAADDDSNIRVSVITGTADSFTSGNDIMDFLQNPASGDESDVVRFLHAIAKIKKPLISAVNGLAVGVGTTMLLHCDLTYASPDASFMMPFVNLALVPEAASSFLLPRMIGHQRAAELLLLGEKFSPEKAKECGIVTEIVPADKLEEIALAAAAKIAAKAPAAVRLTKGLMKGNVEDVMAQMQKEGAVFAERLTSPEAREAMQAFMERRKPDFSQFD